MKHKHIFYVSLIYTVNRWINTLKLPQVSKACRIPGPLMVYIKSLPATWPLWGKLTAGLRGFCPFQQKTDVTFGTLLLGSQNWATYKWVKHSISRACIWKEWWWSHQPNTVRHHYQRWLNHVKPRSTTSTSGLVHCESATSQFLQDHLLIPAF